MPKRFASGVGAMSVEENVGGHRLLRGVISADSLFRGAREVCGNSSDVLMVPSAQSTIAAIPVTRLLQLAGACDPPQHLRQVVVERAAGQHLVGPGFAGAGQEVLGDVRAEGDDAESGR